mmetsp:Transcript_21450/g.40340  ORF Transcript_21450/g.40340 Transcript_21450/m.40340 type:complete len:220 (-) Transcript_21450:267-926(-)
MCSSFCAHLVSIFILAVLATRIAGSLSPIRATRWLRVLASEYSCFAFSLASAWVVLRQVMGGTSPAPSTTAVRNSFIFTFPSFSLGSSSRNLDIGSTFSSSWVSFSGSTSSNSARASFACLSSSMKASMSCVVAIRPQRIIISSASLSPSIPQLPNFLSYSAVSVTMALSSVISQASSFSLGTSKSFSLLAIGTFICRCLRRFSSLSFTMALRSDWAFS